MLRAALVLLLSAGLAACSEDPAPDAGTDAAAGADDAGTLDANRDASTLDLSFRDLGVLDTGTNVDLIFEGEELVRGLRTWIEVRGTRTSTLPTVIVLSRGPEHSHEYLVEPMSFLHEKRLVVYYDMRATGRTAFGMIGTATLTPELHVADVDGIHEYAQGLRASPQVDLVGHGYGASVAALYARANPSKVGRLVLTTPYPATVLQLARLEGETSARLTSTERTLVNTIEMSAECRRDANMCGLVLWGYYGSHFVCEPNRPRFRDLDFRYVSYLSKDFIDYQLRQAQYDWTVDVLPGLTVPTTLVLGPCDPTPPETGDAYRVIPGVEAHVLGGSGHFPMIEEPELYRNVVLHALAR